MGMVALLGPIEGISVVAEAASASEAVAAADDNELDVVIMDLHLGESSGVDATREIAQRHPELGVLVVTMLDDDDSVFASMRAGARGYLLKGADPTEVERAVRAVANGEILLGPRSEEHTSELQSLMRISYAVFCLKKKKQSNNNN